MIRNFFKLIRLSQWIKQIVIFLPLVSAPEIITVEVLWRQCIFAIAFSLIASSIYVINDYFDYESDLLDPINSKRPFAAGLIEKNIGLISILPLVAITVVILIYLQPRWEILAILLIYFFINLAYSILKLKKFDLFGISLIASGFSIRFASGALLVDLKFSFWSFVLMYEFALILLFGKRFQKSVNSKFLGSKDLLDFDTFLRSNFYWLIGVILNSGIFITIYAIFISDFQTRLKWGNSFIILSIIPIILIVLRINQKILILRENSYITDSFYRDYLVVLLGVLYSIFLLAAMV